MTIRLVPWLAMVLLAASVTQAWSDKTTVFDMEGRQILQDEQNLGVVNGRLTAGINYRDVAGIAGLWAPPFVSSNFMLDGRVNGAKVWTTNWLWRPFQVERAGTLDDVAVSTTTTLIYGRRAAVVSFSFRNSGRTSVPLELFSLGWLDSVRDWGFPQPGSGSQTTLEVDGRRLVMRQGKLVVVVGIDSGEWTWEATGNLGHAFASLPAGQKRSLIVVIAMGTADEATAAAGEILADPGGALRAARSEYTRSRPTAKTIAATPRSSVPSTALPQHSA